MHSHPNNMMGDCSARLTPRSTAFTQELGIQDFEVVLGGGLEPDSGLLLVDRGLVSGCYGYASALVTLLFSVRKPMFSQTRKLIAVSPSASNQAQGLVQNPKGKTIKNGIDGNNISWSWQHH